MLKPQKALAVAALLASVACGNSPTQKDTVLSPIPTDDTDSGDLLQFPRKAAIVDFIFPGDDDDSVVDGEDGEGEGEGDVVGEGEGEAIVGEGEGEGEVVTPPPPPPTTTGETRPAASLGQGFFVKNGTVFDKNGDEFIIRGLNHSHAWGHQDNAVRAIPEFVEMGANAVRTVFMPTLGGGTTPAGRRALVETYIANGLVPIVEDHRTTCSDDPSTLRGAVDTWLEPGNVAWLQEYEDKIILNIGNEWMNTSWDHDLWVAEYSAAITRLRAAGIHALIMVDAGGGCAQNPRSIRDRGQDIVNADPEHNVVFDLHMYAYWRSSTAGVGSWNDHGLGSPWSIETELQGIKDRGLAVIVGELGDSSSPQVGYDTKSALETLKRLNIGFLAWSWNSNSDASLDLSVDNMGWRYDSTADLTAGGRLFIEDADVGLQATAQVPDIF